MESRYIEHRYMEHRYMERGYMGHRHMEQRYAQSKRDISPCRAQLEVDYCSIVTQSQIVVQPSAA